MNPIERDLIESAQGGCVVSFEQLINPIERQLLSMAAGLAPCPDEAEDIYQDALISAFSALPRFRLESSFKTWLYRILVNTSISSSRKLKTKLTNLILNERTQQQQDFEQLTNEKWGRNTNPETDLVNQQLSKAISDALLRLSEQERISFVLCHQQELKINDAARVMNCAEGTVKGYLFRAREKMRFELAEFGH